jgi:hypothetical protein
VKDKTTKAAKILALTEKGGSVKDIAKAVKCDDAYVYYVRWMNKNKKKKPSKIVEAVKQTQADLKLPRIKRDEKAEAWKKKNPWFGVDENKTAYALKLHEKLVKEGIDPRSDAYYTRINKEIKLLDTVNQPPHYTDGGVDTLTYIEAKDLNYRLGNVVKYISRCGKKLNSDPLQDLMKARFYLQREIDIRREA